MTAIHIQELMQKVFLMGAMAGELIDAGFSEAAVRRGFEAALIVARQQQEETKAPGGRKWLTI